MKTKLLKIAGIIFGSSAGLALLGFAIYVFLYYPRKAEPFEINTSNQTEKILIATQGSDFKNAFVKVLCDSLKKKSVYIKGINVGELTEVNDEDWDRILIVNSFIIRLNKDIEQFVDNADKPQKILLFVTSGGADWQPKADLKVDAFTSASRKVYIEGQVNLITDWMSKDDNVKWVPDDYLLALRYFPQVDVKTACETITLEVESYKALYPNLLNMINFTGYYYLHIGNIENALEVFWLNIKLFPDFWNVYDSYGEALFRKGDRKGAIKYYRKALGLNPESKSAKKMLSKLGVDL